MPVLPDPSTIDLLWKGAVITGIVSINLKMLGEFISKVKTRRNGKYNGENRREIRYKDDCEGIHDKHEKEADKRNDDMWTKINETHDGVENIKGNIDGFLKAHEILKNKGINEPWPSGK